MGYIKFVLECMLHMLSYVVFDFDKTPAQQKMATYGIIGVGIFAVSFILLALMFCVDRDLYPQKSAIGVLFASLSLMLAYFGVVFLFVK